MATLKDVAKLAGLTTSTVSRVINNRGYISENTRKKVDEAMKDLNHPDYVEKLNKQAPSKGAKMSVREQLRNASQKASARPQSTQKPPKDKTR